MIVVDASVLTPALLDDADEGVRSREFLARDTHWVAPAHLVVEVINAARRQSSAGKVSTARAREAVVTLSQLPISLSDCRPLAARMWDLRHNMTPYDAAYVALAEAMESPLLTADRRLARAPGIGCRIVEV